jgi:hypothetical protein
LADGGLFRSIRNFLLSFVIILGRDLDFYLSVTVGLVIFCHIFELDFSFADMVIHLSEHFLKISAKWAKESRETRTSCPMACGVSFAHGREAWCTVVGNDPAPASQGSSIICIP